MTETNQVPNVEDDGLFFCETSKLLADVKITAEYIVALKLKNVMSVASNPIKKII